MGKLTRWRAKFIGDYTSIYVDKQPAKLTKEKDWLGNIISFTDVIVDPGKEININVIYDETKKLE